MSRCYRYNYNYRYREFSPIPRPFLPSHGNTSKFCYHYNGIYRGYRGITEFRISSSLYTAVHTAENNEKDDGSSDE